MVGKCPARQRVFFRYCERCGKKFSPLKRQGKICDECKLKTWILNILKQTNHNIKRTIKKYPMLKIYNNKSMIKIIKEFDSTINKLRKGLKK